MPDSAPRHAVPALTGLACWLAPVLLALFLQAALTPAGTATSPDSLAYLYTAQSLHAGLGLTVPGTGLQDAAQVPMTLWAPLYPVWLSLFLPDGHQVPANPSGAFALAGAASLANACALALLSLVIQALLRRHFGRVAASALTAAVLVSPALQLVQVYAWSESLCLPLLTACFLTCRLRAAGHPPWLGHCSTLAAALLMALAIATRYASVAFLPVLMLEMVCVPGPASLGLRVRRATATLGLLNLLLLPLWWRNLTISGHLSGGNRTGLRAPLSQYVPDLASSLGHYLLGGQPLLLGGLLAALLLAGWRTRQPNAAALSGAVRPHRAMAGAASDSGWALAWGLSYLGSLLVLSRLQSIDGDGRMIALAAPFLIFAALAAARPRHADLSGWIQQAPVWAIALITLGTGIQTVLQVRAGWQHWGSPRLVTTWRGGSEYNNFTGNPQQYPWRLLADNLRQAAVGGPVVTDLPPLPFRFVTGMTTRRVDLPLSPAVLAQIRQLAEDGMQASGRQAGTGRGALVLTDANRIAALRLLQPDGRAANTPIALDARLTAQVLAVRLPLADQH